MPGTATATRPAGRRAPRRDPAKGWSAILKRVGAEVKQDNVSLLAAGVAIANPRWRWVGWGAVVALVPWLLGSVGFSWYVDNFGNYNQTYGAWPR